LNTRWGELENRVKLSRDGIKDTYHDQIVHLREQSKVAMAKLDEVKTASEHGWEVMVTEMDNIRDAFSHAFRNTKS